MEEFKQILYPVSLTEISPKVAPYVVTLARQLDATVHLLHVLRPLDMLVDTYVLDPPKPDFKQIASDFDSHISAQARARLSAFEKKYLSGTPVARSTVVSGTHYKEILSYAEANGVDLIVMGTGTRIQNMVFGSVADKVSKLSPVPVMLIKCS